MAGKDNRRSPVGGALGLLARRVGNFVSEVSETIATPEGVRDALERLRIRRRAGLPSDIDERAEQEVRELGELPQVRAAQTLGRVQIAFCRAVHSDDRELWIPTLEHVDAPWEQADAERKPENDALSRDPLAMLARATRALVARDPETTHDHLRRSRGIKGVPHADRHELLMWSHALAARAHHMLGDRDRALRELAKCKGHLDADWSMPEFRVCISKLAVDWLLAAGATADAQSWIEELFVRHEDSPGPSTLDDFTWVNRLQLSLRTSAARGDAEGANSVARELHDPGLPEGARAPVRWSQLRSAMTLQGEAGRSFLAVPGLVPERGDSTDADSPAIARLTALAQIRSLEAGDDKASADQLRKAAIAQLCARFESTPPELRASSLHELAFVALWLESTDEKLLQLVRAALDPEHPIAELSLLDSLHRSTNASEDEHRVDDCIAKTLRSAHHVIGPDEVSPLRNGGLRQSILASRHHLILARRRLAAGLPDRAQAHIVEALTHDPNMRAGREVLAAIVQGNAGQRIEDLLRSAIELMSAAPTQLAGREFSVFREAVPRLTSERERLIRPLTIAVMGEFSSGKSTFVNALVGREVAPMGVLPTTCTINRFRNGRSGARAHRRDGWISLLGDDDVKPYLDGLDEVAANDLRFVDIDVDCPELGDMVLVDTPGLNALDGFHESVAREFLNESDAIIWVFSATRAGAGSEAEFLRELDAEDRKVLGVLNKIDTLDAEERRELTTFLNERLGSALVDIVPVSAKAALDHATTEPRSSRTDPLASLRTALDSHFRDRSPQLKLELSVRRTRLVLADVSQQLERQAQQLEEDSKTRARDHLSVEPAELAEVFDELGRQLHDELLDLADHLTREAMGLGLVESGSGLTFSAREQLDEVDISYLETSLAAAALECAETVRAAISRRGPQLSALADCFDRQFTTWARGYADSLSSSRASTGLLLAGGHRARDGERSLRDGFRADLAPLARAWQREFMALQPIVNTQMTHELRKHTHAPRAEALRIREVWIPKLDALSRGLARIAEHIQT